MVSFDDIKSQREAVAIVGLGYVGLPLAVALARHFKVIGFDIKDQRVNELRQGFDRTREVSAENLKQTTINFTSRTSELAKAKVFIVAVPTPVDQGNLPDLFLVRNATETVGKIMSPGSVVVYESTVYPGVTEEICVPILEKESGLKCGADFSVGYSPERINPGDREHTIDKVTKVVAGQDEATAELLAGIYGTVTTIFKASSIKVAEAAKVIENTQRDINIALMNELALICDRLGISIYDVLAAAGTKWNFLKFTPGLVGGHCIGVDPYYLTYKAQMLGYHPEVILAGRRVNDSMPAFIADKIIKEAIRAGKNPSQLTCALWGITFKENVPDARNSKAAEIYKELAKSGFNVSVYDQLAYPDEVEREYGIKLASAGAQAKFDVLIVAVGHDMFKQPVSWLANFLNQGALVIDIKHILDGEAIRASGFNYWSL